MANVRRFAPYELPFAEDVMKVGCLVEVCSFESLVGNADIWKNEFDILVLSSMTISYVSPLTCTQVKTAIQKFKDNDVKLIWYHDSLSPLLLRKWSAVGTYAETLTVSDLFDGLSIFSGYNFSVDTGTLAHSATYPFGITEILRSGKTVTPNPLFSYQSTDPNTIFPIVATSGTYSNVKCVAYKPNKFFVINYGGTVAGDSESGALYNYIYANEIVNILLGKTENIRVSIDAKDGKKIAAMGIDCDIASDLVATKNLMDALGYTRSVELGLVVKNVTADIAGFYRNLNVPVCTHTQSHYNDRVTITGEVQTIGPDGIIRLNRPYRPTITSITTTDDVTTFTKSGTLDFDQAIPNATQYAITEDTTYKMYNGIIKFNLANAGVQVKINYTCDDEALETLGSIKNLRDYGCLTDDGVYTTQGQYSIHAKTYKLAEKDDIIFSEFLDFPANARAWALTAMQKDVKIPYPNGLMMAYQYSKSLIDANYFKSDTKATMKSTFVPGSIARCNSMDLPFVFYGHDFLLSETYDAGIWLSATINADWKKATFQETLDYAKEMYTWIMDTIDAENPIWMTRTEFVRRYNYLNKYLAYDVTEGLDKKTLTVQNKGHKPIKGLTFRVPFTSAPSKVALLKDAPVQYSYVNGVVTAWFDLEAGQSVVLEVS